MLRSKSLTELRGLAQALGVSDIFQKDHAHLVQAIELKTQNIAPPVVPAIPKPEYDARLMTRPPSKRSSEAELRELLQPYVDRGMRLEITEEQWKIAIGKKNDQGTLRMPLRVMLKCAEELMR